MPFSLVGIKKAGNHFDSLHGVLLCFCVVLMITYAIHQSGKWYTDDNIDQMLMERHLSKKARRSSRKCHVKGPKKRTEEDDERFAQSFEKMLLMAREKEGR